MSPTSKGHGEASSEESWLANDSSEYMFCHTSQTLQLNLVESSRESCFFSIGEATSLYKDSFDFTENLLALLALWGLLVGLELSDYSIMKSSL